MTLDEAIKHCEEVANSCERGNPKKRSKDKCAKEHRQLAEWLRELKALRIAVYKLSKIPYGECLTYEADVIWDLFGTLFADFEEEVMGYEEVKNAKVNS